MHDVCVLVTQVTHLILYLMYIDIIVYFCKFLT